MRVLDVLKLRKDGFVKILGIFLTLSSIAGFFHYGVLYYFTLGMFGLMVIYELMKKGIKTNSYIIVFLAICALSLIVNDTLPVFNAWGRLGVYILVLFVVSPMFSNPSVGTKRTKLLMYVMDVCIILSVLSFFAYFLGINLFVRLGEQLEIGVGSFSGLMNHSMVLGPISGLSSVVLLSYCLWEKNKRLRVVYIVALFCCLGSCLLASSRIAVAAAIVGCVFVLFLRFRSSLTKFSIVLLLIVGIAGITFPIWGGLTDFLVEKQQDNIELGGSMMYSRENKINARIAEFKSSPIVGIGFATVNPQLDKVDFSNGRIEPGTSWLAILSMTGLLGMTVFLLICFYTLKKVLSAQNMFFSCALGGMFVFYLAHLAAEGYIMAPRSFLNMLFWLILGAIYSENRNVRSTKKIVRVK
jgi:hypothetical protein